MFRRPLLIANWKMNMGPVDWEAHGSPYWPHNDADVVMMPSAIELPMALSLEFFAGAQCGRAEDTGAFTGDLSIKMLHDLGCDYILCGHSERRKHHGETDAMVLAQATRALALEMQPVVCVGETKEERAAGKAEEVVKRQLKDIPAGVIIAYEPVWAIGTGDTAKPEDAAAMATFIRTQFPGSDDLRVLYGGSITPENADALFSVPEIDGGLVGSASLNPEDFRQILNSLLIAKEDIAVNS